MNKVNICIVHYNTPKLTECLIKSINKFTPNCNIYIFDNSNKQPFTYRQDNITYYDNTKGQIINFDKMDKSISLRHCCTVQKCIELIPDGFILMDSDILLIKDVSSIVDDACVFCGQIEHHTYRWRDRVFPFLLYINGKMIKENAISFFDEKRIVLVGWNRSRNDNYDTGASFLEDVKAKNLPTKLFNKDDYMIHFTSGSHGRKEHEINKWINDNKQYWV